MAPSIAQPHLYPVGPFSGGPFHQACLEHDPRSWIDLPGADRLPVRLQSAHPARKRDFIAGRLCARRALMNLGRETREPLPMREDGLPRWPAGTLGSLTHTRGFASALVAPAGTVRCLGLDSENWIPQKRISRIAPWVITDNERNNARRYSDKWFPRMFTVMYSAKESVIKCMYPLDGIRSGLLDWEIGLEDFGSGRFTFKSTRNSNSEIHPATEGWGGFVIDDQRVMTFVHV